MPPAATATLATSFHHGVLKDSILGEHGETGQKRGSITDIRETSYPSRSLQFLKKDDITLNDAKVKLNIIIVGAGLGGLATAIALARTGHTVTVLEQAAALAEVGAGIQIPSNSSSLLARWGVLEHLGDRAMKPEAMSFRRWKTGDKIGYTKLTPDFTDNFGAPYYVVHRAHFHDALHQRAIQLGVRVLLNSTVAEFDVEKAAVTLADGATMEGDLVVAADGVKSVARAFINNGIDRAPTQTGFAVYRATVKAELIRQDPEISWLLEKPSLNIWIGEGRHVMTYTIASGSSFNMVLSHVDDTDPSTWKREDAIPDMRREFADWDPALIKIINLIDHAIKWPLMTGQRLTSWSSASSKIIILGDAAHAMVPYMSQGAAMAVEDGAALATVLSLITSHSQIPKALKVFEKERITRTSQMQEASLLNGKIWHFADGPEQRARDEAMKKEVNNEHFTWSPNQWSDPVTQWWAYGYDAEAEMRRAWERIGKL